MHPEVKVWLKDIQLSINEINEFLSPPRNYILFQKDLKTRKAIERNIEIIVSLFLYPGRRKAEGGKKVRM